MNIIPASPAALSSYPQSITIDGITYDMGEDLVIKSVYHSALASGNSFALWTPATDKRIYLMGFSIAQDTVGRFALLEDAAVLVNHYVIAGTPVVFNSPGWGYKFAAVNTPLKFNNFTAGPIVIGGLAWGLEIP